LARTPKNVLVGVSLATLYLVWSSTYLALRYLVDAAPVLLSCGARYMLAGLVLYVGSRVSGGERPSKRAWLAAIPSGGLLFLVGNGFVALAETTVGSGLAAVVCAAMPLFLAVFGALSGERTSRAEWLGLGLGFAGVVLLGAADLRSSSLAGLFLGFAPIGWALGSLLAKRLPLAKGAMAPATQMITGGVIDLLVGLARGERFDSTPPVRAWLAFGYLVVFGSIAAFSAYAYLLRTTRPATATSYAYVNPMLAVLLGVAVGHEHLAPTSLVATLLVVGGVALTMKARVTAQRSSNESLAPREDARSARRAEGLHESPLVREIPEHEVRACARAKDAAIAQPE
jgi:drug/metabolite transporter (DMT)-like permease